MTEDAIALGQITNLLDQGDFRQAGQLLKPIYQRRPADPQVLFLVARVNELGDRIEVAEKIFRDLMQSSAAPPQLINRARQGLKRLECGDRNRRLARVQAAKQLHPDRQGLLILEATPAEQRNAFAQQVARIFDIDVYSAKMKLQSHGWRLYRLGNYAELEVYSRDLQVIGMPAFCFDRAEINTIDVFRVEYFEQFEPEPIVICRDDQHQIGKLQFAWSEVTQQVRGGLPVFIDAISFDMSKADDQKIKRKPEIRDYVQMCDLHLPQRRCILRFCDQSYHFQSGVVFTEEQRQHLAQLEQLEQLEALERLEQASAMQGLKPSEATTRLNWNGMLAAIEAACPNLPIWREFTQFAETTLDYDLLLASITPHVMLDRKTPTNWDPAFQLYSTAAFLRQAGTVQT